MSKFDKLKRTLNDMASGANTSCKDFTTALGELGFDVRAGSNGGHKVVTHPALPSWNGANYNCGHSPGTMVKRPYIKIFTKIVAEYEDQLREHMK